MVEQQYEATAWGNAPKPFEIKLPSGQLALVKKLQMEDIIRLDLVDALDTFTSVVGDDRKKKPQDHKKTKKQIADEQAEKTLKMFTDKEAFERLIKTMNKVVIDCVVAPKVHDTPAEGDPREEGIAYIDYIQMNDKFFIFNNVFDGMSDLGDFRGEQSPDLGNVAAQQSVGNPA